MKPRTPPGSVRPRGWSVLQAGAGLGSLHRHHDRYLRALWQSRRKGFFGVVLLALLLWGGFSIIGSDHGLLRLQNLRRQQTDLERRVGELAAQDAEVRKELNEDPLTEIERPLREKYRGSKPNEIIFQIERSPSDSSTSAPAGAPEETGGGGGGGE